MIVIYLSIAFEWKMAVAALIALAHDIVITVGVYALAHFQVSPASVIGLLTILGYSLYDTVVVFDKVRENTAGLLASSRSTYSQAANQALNQTLVRSINTSIIALLPVASILFVGAGFLGAGELKDQSVVGMKILRGARRPGEPSGEGEILDPDEGRVYRCTVTLIDGGAKLEVRGYVGISLFGRTQLWLRVE